MELLTALTIGFLGSFHCIGMCGPIAVALPVPRSSNIVFFSGRVLYNFGRLISYGIMGLLFGFLGKGFVAWGYQQSLSIALGVIIIILLVIPAKYKNKFLGMNIILKITEPLKRSIGKLFKRTSLPSFLLIGFLNGFLPCGFVYIGLAGAAATGAPVTGMLFMVLFGLGTVPAMLAVSLFGKLISLNVRKKISRAIPVLAFMLALIFILRGLNLGIPYLSPKMMGTKTMMMHHE
jgi:sulfite exporter TauE/SafE